MRASTSEGDDDVRGEELDPDVLSAALPDPAVTSALGKAIRQAVATAGPGYGEALRALQEAVAKADPVALMGPIAVRYGTAQAGTNPEFDRRDGMYWHHIEIVQAFALRRAANPDPRPLPEIVPEVVDAVTGLNRAWLVLEARRVDQAQQARRAREIALVHLRTHAHAIRGAAYAGPQRAMLEDLLRPLDDDSERRIGVRLSTLPGWWEALLATITTRLGEMAARLQEAERWPIDDAWLERVRTELGMLPEQVPIELGPMRTNRDLLRWFLASSAETRAHELFRFDVAELATCAPGGLPHHTVRAILARWSLALGDDGGVALHDVVLPNPVVARPFAATGTDQWHLFCPWLPHHNSFALIESAIAGDADLFEAYMQRRSAFLEERTAAVLARALPGAAVEHSVNSVDSLDGRTYENDVLALLGSHAIVAEAKGGRLAPEARRGAGRALRDKIEDLLVAPSRQARRLADELYTATGTTRFTRKADGTTFDVDRSTVRRALSVGVTLDPIAEQLPRLADLAQAGLTDEALDALVYSISLADLELVADVLNHPSELLHWLERRGEISRDTWLKGDEMDLLGLYLQTGFNLGEKEFDPSIGLDVTGMSDPIDLWQYGIETGSQVERPRVRRTEWWEACLTRVERQRPARWTEIGVAMCSIAPPEQRELLTARDDLRDAVNTGRRSPADFVVFHNGPPQHRTVIIGMIATSLDPKDRAAQFARAQQAAREVASGNPAVIMSWRPSHTDLPYYGIALASAC